MSCFTHDCPVKMTYGCQCINISVNLIFLNCPKEEGKEQGSARVNAAGDAADATDEQR